jgi:predicted metal-dependent phosphoesterase TrpH/glycosyltransferase involved in cell wall biosynthesis
MAVPDRLAAATRLGPGMGFRVALVTPFSWSQPHDVNEHVTGLARELRRRGHAVTVLAPSNRGRDLAAGRRALQNGSDDELIALGPAVPISRRSRMGVPVGVRANLAIALAGGRFDIVHGFEPGLPSLSYLALRDSGALTAATFFSEERLGYPPGKAQRERLLARLDTLLATSEATAEAAAVRFPGRYEVVPLGVDLELFRPAAKRKVVVLEWRQAERPLLRALVREVAATRDWELVLVRTKPLGGRPTLSRLLRGRVRVRTARDGESRAEVLRDAAVFVPALEGLARLELEAQAAGAAIAAPPGRHLQPELAAADAGRLMEDATLRASRAEEGAAIAAAQSFPALADAVEAVYESMAGRRRRSTAQRAVPLEDRDWILADLHMHTNWSHDCSIDVDELLDHAEAEGLGAIAVTDHNVIGGALEAVERARNRRIVVIPGEEIKTDGQGEVIGLFLKEEIPRGLSFPDTVAAIRAQGGLVYMPHPFDRLHSIADPSTLHRHLAEIDVFETYNARLLFEAYNDEALRFARKYNLTAGAGSDAHVLQGVGTGAVRMRRFNGPEEFLISLRNAEILRRPKSLVYLQGLKWVAQAKERVR